jgi:hypothetical protein
MLVLFVMPRFMRGIHVAPGKMDAPDVKLVLGPAGACPWAGLRPDPRGGTRGPGHD